MSATGPVPDGDPDPVPPPVLQHAFDLHVDVAPTQRIGHGAGEVLEFTPIVGGTVTGPLLTGTVEPFGGDWSTTRDGVTTLEARYLIRADDGAVIDIVNRGFWRDRDRYFRTSPVFRTDASQHAWLAEHVFAGDAHDEGDTRIVIRVFVVR